MKITLFTPVVGPAYGKGLWSACTQLKGPDRDEAIRKGNSLQSVKVGQYELKRVDEEVVNDYEYYKPLPR